ncbi:hypothetical protein [Streptomyces sp. TR02-1]|uniref:hypothetical protein n=1 Tax=Streptomyces sp. TR02-1 TaxID=3385977 RepID=UPI0039A0F244
MRNPDHMMRNYTTQGPLRLDPSADALNEWDTDASNLIKESAVKHRDAFQASDPALTASLRSEADQLVYDALAELFDSAGNSVHVGFLKALVTRLVELETKLLMH